MEEHNKFEAIIDTGSAVIGNAAGAALTNIVGITGGVLSGQIISHIIKKLGNEIFSRHLSPREKERIMEVLRIAVQKIDERIKSGEKIRDDEFFTDTKGRTSGEEVLEGILLIAQREHEEKKNIYYSNFLTNIAFDNSIDKSEANFFIKLIERLTYLDLCLLRFAALTDKTSMRQSDYRGFQDSTTKLVNLLTQIYSLYNQALINFAGTALLGPSDINPSSMNIQGVGVQLYNLMGLSKIPLTDIDSIAEILKK